MTTEHAPVGATSFTDKIECFLRLNIIADARDQARVELMGMLREAYRNGKDDQLLVGAISAATACDNL